MGTATGRLQESQAVELRVRTNTSPLCSVYSYKQKCVHLLPLTSAVQKEFYFFREELVAGQYCAQAVGGWSRLYHTILRT